MYRSQIDFWRNRQKKGDGERGRADGAAMREDRFASLSKILVWIRLVCMCVRALETTWPRLLCLGVSAESTKGYPYLIKLLLRIDCQTWGPTAAAGEIIEVPRSLSRSLDPHGRNECLLSNLANFQLNLAFFASRVSSPVMYIQPFANNFSSRLKVATISPNWKHVRDLT